MREEREDVFEKYSTKANGYYTRLTGGRLVVDLRVLRVCEGAPTLLFSLPALHILRASQWHPRRYAAGGGLTSFPVF